MSRVLNWYTAGWYWVFGQFEFSKMTVDIDTIPSSGPFHMKHFAVLDVSSGFLAVGAWVCEGIRLCFAPSPPGHTAIAFDHREPWVCLEATDCMGALS